MKKLIPCLFAVLALVPLTSFADAEVKIKVLDVICSCNYDPDSSSYSDSENPAILAKAETELFIKCTKFLSNGKDIAITDNVKAMNQTPEACAPEAQQKEETKMKATASLEKKLPKTPKVNLDKLACECVSSNELQDKNYMVKCDMEYMDKTGRPKRDKSKYLRNVKFATEQLCRDRMDRLNRKFEQMKQKEEADKRAAEDKVKTTEHKRR